MPAHVFDTNASMRAVVDGGCETCRSAGTAQHSDREHQQGACGQDACDGRVESCAVAKAKRRHREDGDGGCIEPAMPSSTPPRTMEALREVVRGLMHELECLLHEYLSFNWDRVDDVLEVNKHLLRDDGLACLWMRNGASRVSAAPPLVAWLLVWPSTLAQGMYAACSSIFRSSCCHTPPSHWSGPMLHEQQSGVQGIGRAARLALSMFSI